MKSFFVTICKEARLLDWSTSLDRSVDQSYGKGDSAFGQKDRELRYLRDCDDSAWLGMDVDHGRGVDIAQGDLI